VPREDEESLADAFWGVAAQLRSSARESLAQWDISPSHSRAIRVLTRHGTLRLSALSEHLRIAPRSTTEVVDALEERGLVVRRPDPDDRRATLVELTAKGREVAQSIRDSRAAELQRSFGRLSETDRASLTRILRKLRADPGQP
jgi:DNA-binding MarR family transcriptional regulator